VSDLKVPAGWSDRFESVWGKRRDVWPIAALLIVGVACVVFLRFRTPPPQIAPPATLPAASPTVGSSPIGRPVFVHVAGAVRSPGLYELPDGSRVADAIEAAGGATVGADVSAVNLAELVMDGVKIEVPKRGEVVAAAASPSPGALSATGTSAAVNLNTADVPTLETIPGIGPVLAAAIVAHRDENGPFPSVDALLDVSGIGPATLESMRSYVTV
jgi:competence protein ComEA